MSIVRARTKPKASRQPRVADSYDARRADNRSSWRSYSSYSFMRDVHGSSAGSSSRATYKRPKPTTIKESPVDRNRRLMELATPKCDRRDW